MSQSEENNAVECKENEKPPHLISLNKSKIVLGIYIRDNFYNKSITILPPETGHTTNISLDPKLFENLNQKESKELFDKLAATDHVGTYIKIQINSNKYLTGIYSLYFKKILSIINKNECTFTNTINSEFISNKR